MAEPVAPLDEDARFATEQFIAHYDPSRIYTRATDDRGHSTTLRATLPPHVAGMIRALVSDPNTPHRSMNDAIRDALYHWGYWWTEELRKSPGRPPVMHPNILLTEMERIRERAIQTRQTLEELRDWYRDGVDADDWVKFTKTLADLGQMVNTTQRRDYDRLLEEIDRDRER